MKNLTDTLELYLVKKAPAIPANIKTLLVQYAPWLSILVIIVSLPAILALFGLSAIVNPMMGGYIMANAGFNITLAVIFLAVSLVLRCLSLQGLFSKTKNGWNMMYYATLVSAVYSLLRLDLVGLVVGTGISLYLIFQVRSLYTDKTKK